MASSEPGSPFVLESTPKHGKKKFASSLTIISTLPKASSNSSFALIGVLSRSGSLSRPRKISSPAFALNPKTSWSGEGAGPDRAPRK